jgi:hypothetical protein
MDLQVKTQLIADWLGGPFYEGLPENIRRAALPAISHAAVKLDEGARGIKNAYFGKVTTPAQVASWLENDYWPIFIRRHSRYGTVLDKVPEEVQRAGAIALDKAVQKLRSGEWLHEIQI